MRTDETIIIPLSRTKLLVTAIGAAALVVCGVVMLFITETHSPVNPVLVTLAGVSAILFFGMIALSAIRKMADRAPGLEIGPEGLVDNASGAAAGRIPWSSITGISVSEVVSQKFLTLHLNDPAAYPTGGSAMNRMAASGNARLTGSPVNIPSTTLHVDFDELVGLVRSYHQRYGSGREQQG